MPVNIYAGRDILEVHAPRSVFSRSLAARGGDVSVS